MEWLSANLAPIMFGCLALFLLTGFPVAFGLAATGLFFGLIGMELGLLPASLFQALPLRIFGIMQNDTLLAIPFFTLMGLILERSGMAEDLLETVGQVFGPLRGGLALAVVFVGALLAATTGVVAASVISMGLISLPIMLRYGYSRRIAAGVITSSGALAQVIPPSLVLIVMADQLGRSVGEMYIGALMPALIIVSLYALYVIMLAFFVPKMVPALPPEARLYKEPNGASGHKSLIVLALVSTISAYLAIKFYPNLMIAIDRNPNVQADELTIVALCGGFVFAFVVAVINRLLGLRLLSMLAERVTFVLIPPLILIFLVLGTIFLGVATPTEGGAMGAAGAILLAMVRGRLSFSLMRQAMLSTTKLSCFVLFILIGSTTFALTFTGVDGPIWVEHLFDQLPGGVMGFMIVVTVMIFLLGFFLDFFEIAFILLPLLGPVAEKMGIDLIWFGVLVGINLQTSFLTPPFGFALFYLRSVAPKVDYKDEVTGENIRRVTTGEIYQGALPFVGLQLIVMALIITFPQIVTGNLKRGPAINIDDVRLEMPEGGGFGMPTPEAFGAPPEQGNGRGGGLGFPMPEGPGFGAPPPPN